MPGLRKQSAPTNAPTRRSLDTTASLQSLARLPDASLTRYPFGQRSIQPCRPSVRMLERPHRDPTSPTATHHAPRSRHPRRRGTAVRDHPEWVIDAALSDGAFRLYSLLLRYGNGSGSRMPSRQTLARRLRRSVDAVDRAMRQLTEAGIVRVEHRRNGEQFLSNRYHVRTTASAGVTSAGGGGRRSTATPEPSTTGSRRNAATGGRSSAARVAAKVRHNPEILTDKPPPPTPHTAAGLRRRRWRRQPTICSKPAPSPTSTSWPGSA